MKFVKEIPNNFRDNFLQINFTKDVIKNNDNFCYNIKLSKENNVCGLQLKALRTILSSYASQCEYCLVTGDNEVVLNSILAALNDHLPFEPFNEKIYLKAKEIFGQKL